LSLNLADLLDRSAACWPDRNAVVDGSTAVTYGGLAQQVACAARAFNAAGIGGGQMVGHQSGNSVAFIVVTYALWRCGAVAVPIPAEMGPAERAELIRRMDLAAVVAGAPLPDGSRTAQVEVAGASVWLTKFHERPAPASGRVHAALVRFTSGTTNANKGVVLTHEGIQERIESAGRAFQIGAGDTVIWSLPMAHHFVVTIIQYLWKGAAIVLVKDTVAGPYLDAVIGNGGTVLYASPFQYEALARDASGRMMPSVRLAVSTTTGLSRDTARAFRDRYGLCLTQAYGIIELGLPCMNLDDPEGHPTSVGRPAPGFQVRIVNQAQYSDLGEGCGEVEIAGPGFFAGYNDPWTPASAIMNGPWFHTGDVGWMDSDGFLFLRSRTNSVINVAGMKVFAEEVEAVLNAHGAVLESRAYGRKHDHLGEVVEAEVVLRGGIPPVTEQELRLHCADRLSPLKVPNRIHFRAAIEKTPVTGKIKRRAAPEAASS
jgi:long-chain acyl-CoA synthetase